MLLLIFTVLISILRILPRPLLFRLLLLSILFSLHYSMFGTLNPFMSNRIPESDLCIISPRLRWLADETEALKVEQARLQALSEGNNGEGAADEWERLRERWKRAQVELEVVVQEGCIKPVPS
ncbi:hypothetical protein BKA70DRAFT_476255 [Coprinopsis sp. MPI-PUGE-AT-0042]|nr:hypothetical protein BKA70DRAFT_476255 [Coprinopsis sp. MPI-PUGE-AT-0042]